MAEQTRTREQRCKDPEFQAWLDKLNAHAKDLDPETCSVALSDQTGEDCWLDYFESKYTPEDALSEDWSYG